jgi:hypothetical protein
MEAAGTSETLVNFYQTTQHYNPEDSHLHNLNFYSDNPPPPQSSAEVKNEWDLYLPHKRLYGV